MDRDELCLLPGLDRLLGLARGAFSRSINASQHGAAIQTAIELAESDLRTDGRQHDRAVAVADEARAAFLAAPNSKAAKFQVAHAEAVAAHYRLQGEIYKRRLRMMNALMPVLSELADDHLVAAHHAYAAVQALEWREIGPATAPWADDDEHQALPWWWPLRGLADSDALRAAKKVWTKF
jgi:hypothetical protein